MMIAIVSFVPMLLVSALILDQFDTSYNEKLYAHLKEVVHKHTIDIDSFLNERLNNIQFLSEFCCFEDMLDESVLQKKLFMLQQTYGDAFEDLGIVNKQVCKNSMPGGSNWKKHSIRTPNGSPRRSKAGIISAMFSSACVPVPISSYP